MTCRGRLAVGSPTDNSSSAKFLGKRINLSLANGSFATIVIDAPDVHFALRTTAYELCRASNFLMVAIEVLLSRPAPIFAYIQITISHKWLDAYANLVYLSGRRRKHVSLASRSKDPRLLSLLLVLESECFEIEFRERKTGTECSAMRP